MKRFSKPVLVIALFVTVVFLATVCSQSAAEQTDVLPTWNDGSTRQSIIEFFVQF